MIEAVVFNSSSEWNFWKMAIFEMDGFDYLDVCALRLGEMVFVIVIEVDGSNKTVSEEGVASRDGGVGIQEVRWEFEYEVLSEDSVRNDVTNGGVDNLVNVTVDSGISEGVIMGEEPAHGE